jgi:hypothetical protein
MRPAIVEERTRPPPADKPRPKVKRGRPHRLLRRILTTISLNFLEECKPLSVVPWQSGVPHEIMAPALRQDRAGTEAYTKERRGASPLGRTLASQNASIAVAGRISADSPSYFKIGRGLSP